MGKRSFHRRISAHLIHLASFAAIACVNDAYAEPVMDDLVAGAQVVANENCALLKVRFHVRVRYVGHFPQERAKELRISLDAIDPPRVDQLRLIHREIAAIDNNNTGIIESVTLEVSRAIGPTLRILFNRPTAYEVGQVESFDSIAVALPRPGNAKPCRVADFASPGASGSQGANNGLSSRQGAERAKRNRAASISAADTKFAEASMDEARYEMRKRDYKKAIALLEKILKLPESRVTAEALETLGEARQKAGQEARARADFDEYLRLYPDGDGAARVRRRLGEVESATSVAARARGPQDSVSMAPMAPDPPREIPSIWMMSGSISSFYIRDDSYNTVKDISIAPNPNADPDAHRLHQDTFLTNFDLFGTINNEQVRTKFKISGADEHRLQTDSLHVDRYGISTAFVETTLKEADVTLRVGRQTRNTGGVIGRFDGGVASWQASDMFRLNAVAGAANWSRFDAPFRDGRYLFGVSVDVAKLFDGFDASLFAIQQNDRWFLDRRAVGGEFRYFQDGKSLLGMVDYDLHFQRLNAAVLSGSWTFPDASVLSGTFDNRRVPYLSSWNALLGQPFFTLYDMIKFNAASDIRRFAIDRTPTFQSATASYSKPINDNFQVSVDATTTYLGGTIASGGVDGTLPSGREYYFSGQLAATNLLSPGDMYVGALRYARLSDSNVYFLDLNSRYLWNENLQISPRFRAGYREGRIIPLRETTFLPSLLIDYRWTKDLVLETEIGTKWIENRSAGIKTNTTDLYVTLGLRADFSTDGVYRCAGQLAPCSGLLLGPPSSIQQATYDSLYYRESTLFNPEAPPVTSAFVVESGLRYWLNRGGNSYDYFADETTTTRVSRLAYADLKSNTGEVFFRADARRGLIRNMFLKGYVGGGRLTGGRLYDEDFPPVTELYSRTVSETSGKLRYASVDLGYNIYTDPLFRLGAFVGFHTWFERLDARGCLQTALSPICAPPLPSSVRVISEKDRWNSFRIGAVVDVNLTDRLRWAGEIALTSNSQRALDTHYFTFGDDPAKGNGGGFQAETSLRYRITDNFDVGVGFRWWRASNNAVDAYGQLLKYRTDRLGVFGQVSYRLNWGDFPIVTEEAR